MGGVYLPEILNSFIINGLWHETKQSAGITVEGATPTEGGKGGQRHVHLTPLSCRTSGPKRRVAPSTSPPLVRRAGAPGEGGGTRGAASHRFFALDAENACCFASDAAFRENPEPQWGGLPPLRVQRCGCQTRAQHYFVAVSPIRRHRRDPRRRKLSIDPRPLDTGFSCSHWRISFTTALKPPWRSMVSQSASAMACRSPTASVLAAAGPRVVQAWRTRWVRSRWCWSQATAKTSTARPAWRSLSQSCR